MFDWRVGLREHEGKWFAAGLNEHNKPLIHCKSGFTTPGKAVDQLHKEVQDWHAYQRARYPL